MQREELEVSLREGTGKGVARKLRAQGLVPGIVYSGGTPATAVQVDARRLNKLIMSSANALVDLKGPKDVKGKLVLIKDAQRDPVSQSLLHCDFYAVDVKKKIQVNVPLQFTGKAPGVEEGGILEPVLREVEVACLPLAMPESIEVSVDHLGIGGSVHTRELTLPEGVESLGDPDAVVVHVVTPRVEEEPEPTEEEAVEAVEGEAPKEGEEPAAETPEAGE
jgi:large subunit ribosomal protein L25